MYGEGDWENESVGRREKRKDIVADKEFEIFDDTYVYDSQGNEDGNTSDAEIHRRNIAEVDEVWIGIFAEILFPFSIIRFSVKSRSTHVENRMGLRATWLVASNGGAKSDPLSPRDKSKIWHQKESPAEDDPGKKGT